MLISKAIEQFRGQLEEWRGFETAADRARDSSDLTRRGSTN